MRLLHSASCGLKDSVLIRTQSNTAGKWLPMEAMVLRYSNAKQSGWIDATYDPLLCLHCTQFTLCLVTPLKRRTLHSWQQTKERIVSTSTESSGKCSWIYHLGRRVRFILIFIVCGFMCCDCHLNKDTSILVNIKYHHSYTCTMYGCGTAGTQCSLSPRSFFAAKKIWTSFRRKKPNSIPPHKILLASYCIYQCTGKQHTERDHRESKNARKMGSISDYFRLCWQVFPWLGDKLVMEMSSTYISIPSIRSFPKDRDSFISTPRTSLTAHPFRRILPVSWIIFRSRPSHCPAWDIIAPEASRRLVGVEIDLICLYNFPSLFGCSFVGWVAGCTLVFQVYGVVSNDRDADTKRVTHRQEHCACLPLLNRLLQKF